MVTKKSINAVLPRLDELRRSFLLPCSTGRIPHPHMQHLKCVMLDIDPNTGKASRCVVYGVGDALEYDHYYGKDCVDITEQVKDWMRDPDVTREKCVSAIYHLLTEEDQ